MFGFLIGTACLVGLFAVLRRGRRYGFGHGCGGGYGYGGYGGHGGWEGSSRSGYGRGPWARGGGGFGPRFFMRRAFERLDTTPGQEKVIVSAIDELREALHKAKDELRGTKDDFAGVVRGPMLDESTMSDIFTKHDTTISSARRAVVEALSKIHEALNEKQREQIADLLTKGPRGMGGGFGWGGGPYRRSQWV